jgi:hypothetical protein
MLYIPEDPRKGRKEGSMHENIREGEAPAEPEHWFQRSRSFAQSKRVGKSSRIEDE